MRPRYKSAIIKSISTVINLAFIVLCAIYVYELSLAVYYSVVIALSIDTVVVCAVDGEKQPHIMRTALVVGVLLCLTVGLYLLWYMTDLSVRFSDFEEIKRFIVGSGFRGYLVFIGLTVFQVVVLPIPAAVTILLGVAVYGATVSFVLSVIGTIIGSLLSFALGKVFGRRLCNWMFGAEKTDKYAQLVGERGRFLFIIMLLFPAFPDDMLCMIAGITNMTYRYFTVVCILTRPLMIGLTAYLGSGIIPFSGGGIPIWIALGCLMFLAFLAVTRLKTYIERRRVESSARKTL